MGKKSLNLKLPIKTLTFRLNFVCLGNIFNGFSATEPRGVSLNKNVYFFQLIAILLINLTY